MCDQYWPEHQALYGQIEVSLHRTEVLANFTIRTFLLTHHNLGKKGDIRHVTHLQYTCWPAHTNPSNPLPLLSFIRLALKQNELRNSSMVVHTNQNNSRAGVFITIASTLKQLKTSGEVNIPSFLKQAPIKGQNLLKSAKDFIYIHDVLVEAIVAGETNIKNSYLSRYINSLQSCQYSETGNKYHIERQFDLLNIDFVKKDKVKVYDKNEIIWLPGYFNQKAFMVSTYPENENLHQFWRLVLEHNVHTVVVLKSDPEFSFPDLSTDGIGGVTVTHRDDEISYDFKSKNFILEFGANTRKFVKVIFAESFLTDPDNIEDNLLVLETVETRRKSLNPSAPVFILDTAVTGAAGGSFCALQCVLQQVEQEQHCDVYKAVKTVNMIRRGVWPDTDNLLLIYKIVELFINKVKIKYSQEKNNNNVNVIQQKKKSQFRINSGHPKDKHTGTLMTMPAQVPIMNGGWF